jgi:hypothetical protein
MNEFVSKDKGANRVAYWAKWLRNRSAYAGRLYGNPQFRTQGLAAHCSKRVVMERRIDARALATQALNDLGTPGVTLEQVIRTSIRVAALCGHPAMRAWLELQTLDLTNASSDRILLREAVERSISDRERAERITDTVLKDYVHGRTTHSDPDQVYGRSIDRLEELATMFSSEVTNSPGPVPDEILRGYNSTRQVMMQIKNRVANYLVGIESEGGSSLPDD